MHEHIRHRCVKLGQLLVETGETVRAIAKMTGYSKSTVHKDLTERLEKVNETLSTDVKQVLAYHKSIRHLRGGEATRKKWQQKQHKDQQTHMDEKAF
ncbi:MULTISPECIES: sporulation transcriptional regulator SpoIIID [unclassified Lysinibacillus]|uniref:sporulation transcriptional regulator SpoIIID n=1 Tax=unclassified Lysinibacillus TaxID=2636778 RepID=UPI0036E1D4FF